MADLNTAWGDTLTYVLALAAKLEGQGQYNNAKLLRAAAESLARRAAHRLDLPSDPGQLMGEIDRAINVLAALDVGEDLLAALQRGAAAMAAGRLPLIHETPHPYVCRTCGHLVLGEPAHKCPVCGTWPATFKRFLPVYWLNALA